MRPRAGASPAARHPQACASRLSYDLKLRCGCVLFVSRQPENGNRTRTLHSITRASQSCRDGRGQRVGQRLYLVMASAQTAGTGPGRHAALSASA